MTNEQINIAIAKHCGWTSFGMFSGRSDRPAAFRPGCTSPEVIPDFCGDLNAMHEAEKVLTDDQYHTGYKQALASLVGLSGNMRVPSATARQRAEAFLRTIGKWKEDAK